MMKMNRMLWAFLLLGSSAVMFGALEDKGGDLGSGQKSGWLEQGKKTLTDWLGGAVQPENIGYYAPALAQGMYEWGRLMSGAEDAKKGLTSSFGMGLMGHFAPKFGRYIMDSKSPLVFMVPGLAALYGSLVSNATVRRYAEKLLKWNEKYNFNFADILNIALGKAVYPKLVSTAIQNPAAAPGIATLAPLGMYAQLEALSLDSLKKFLSSHPMIRKLVENLAWFGAPPAIVLGIAYYFLQKYKNEQEKFYDKYSGQENKPFN